MKVFLLNVKAALTGPLSAQSSWRLADRVFMKNKEKDKISFQKTKVDSKYDLSLGQKTFHPRGQHPSLSVSNTRFQKQKLLPLNFKASFCPMHQCWVTIKMNLIVAEEVCASILSSEIYNIILKLKHRLDHLDHGDHREWPPGQPGPTWQHWPSWPPWLGRPLRPPRPSE